MITHKSLVQKTTLAIPQQISENIQNPLIFIQEDRPAVHMHNEFHKKIQNPQILSPKEQIKRKKEVRNG